MRERHGPAAEHERFCPFDIDLDHVHSVRSGRCQQVVQAPRGYDETGPHRDRRRAVDRDDPPVAPVRLQGDRSCPVCYGDWEHLDVVEGVVLGAVLEQCDVVGVGLDRYHPARRPHDRRGKKAEPADVGAYVDERGPGGQLLAQGGGNLAGVVPCA